MQTNTEIKKLFTLLVAGQILDGDRAHFYDLILQPENDETFDRVLKEFREESNRMGPGELQTYNTADWEEMITTILDQRTSIPLYRRPWLRAAAAVFIGILVLSVYLVSKPKPQAETARTETKSFHIAPGGYKATLTLGSGAQIILDSIYNGLVASQPGSEIIKTDSGQVSYKSREAKLNSDVVYNTLTTPRGGQFRVTLPDGTGVWLNAESSITFPTVFSGHTRKVEIRGEAYLEVAHNKKMPFVVTKGETAVQVLGTHFDINAYNDEPQMEVTLLEGSVEVHSNSQDITLSPNEQARIHSDGIEKIRNVDVNHVMAWKNGLFDFGAHTDLKALLRQLARWYDIEVEYPANMASRQFGGQISRNSDISQILDILKTSGVHFSMENRKLIIMP